MEDSEHERLYGDVLESLMMIEIRLTDLEKRSDKYGIYICLVASLMLTIVALFYLLCW